MIQQRSFYAVAIRALESVLYPPISLGVSPPTTTTTLLAQSAAVGTSTTLSTAWDLSDLWKRLTQRIRHWMKSLWDLLVLAARGTEVAVLLSPLLILTPAAMLANPFLTSSSIEQEQQINHNFVSDAAWRYTTATMQTLGPVFVKLCQWVATRPDIFPPHVCQRLSCLHDRGLPHAWIHTERALREAFGDDYETRGLHINNSPAVILGCGSAAQVYRGTLTNQDDGTTRPVAVKVLHPQFRQLVERDLNILQTLADWVHAIPLDVIRMINLPRVASNFGELLQAQADLKREAQHLQQFRRNFYGDSVDTVDENSNITFPRPLWDSTMVLVEDLVHDARPIAEFLRDDSEDGKIIRKQLAGPLLRAFLKMIFIDNFTHGDLHPGNVLVQTRQVPIQPNLWQSWFGGSTNNHNKLPHAEDNEGEGQQPKTTTKRTIVFLDAGIATQLSPMDQRNLLDLFRAVILNKGEEAGRLMVERAKYERCSQTPGGVDAFAAGIGALVAEFHDSRKSGLTLGAVRIGSLLSRVLDLCRIHGVEIDPSMASIVVSTLVLEGLGRALEPSLNLMDFAMPFVLGRGRV